MHTAVTFGQKLSADGFAIVPGLVNTKEIADLIVCLEDLGEINSIRKHGKIFAARNLLDVAPEISALLKAPDACEIVRSALDSQAFPVRGIPFDKTPNAQLEGSLASGPHHSRSGEKTTRRIRPLLHKRCGCSRPATSPCVRRHAFYPYPSRSMRNRQWRIESSFRFASPRPHQRNRGRAVRLGKHLRLLCCSSRRRGVDAAIATTLFIALNNAETSKSDSHRLRGLPTALRIEVGS